ncbi:hypothetical protein FPV67DRAFT_1164802 [Lyophyllum atratum]|nr:hypothetical protein FPV67DRAFT_1164802 [Lyophyllum atratum]
MYVGIMDGQYNPNYGQVEAFIALQIIGAALFILVAFSAFIAQIRGGRRHATFFSFCFAWVAFCISFSLLYFAGQQDARPTPEHGLCVVHSALVYAAPPLASSATISLVTHLLLNVLLALSSTSDKRRSSWTSAALIIVPWTIWVAVFIGVLLFGFHHPELVAVSPNGTFCVLVNTTLPKLTSVWATIASTVLVGEEVVIAVLLYRNRDILSGLGHNKTMAIRVGIFSILGVGAIAVALVYTVTQKRGVQFDLLIAAIPPSTAIIFGSQMDILRVWLFWKKHENTETAHGDERSGILTTILSSRMTASIPAHSGSASRTV